MKNFQLLVILIIILIAMSFIQKENLGSKENQKKNIMTSSPTPTQTPTPILTQTPSPTLVLSTLTPAPSSQKDIRSFIYPGSTILTQSDKEMILQSLDDSSSITNWYKEKITSLNMKAQSFVQTNTNGNILNKLVGASAGFKVRIQIQKSSSDLTTTINISLE